MLPDQNVGASSHSRCPIPSVRHPTAFLCSFRTSRLRPSGFSLRYRYSGLRDGRTTTSPRMTTVPGPKMASLPPPPGGDYNRAAEVHTFTWVMVIISIIFVLGRMYSRSKLTKNVWWDDWCICAALVRSRYPRYPLSQD